jgi:hypothetical protein
MTSEVRVKLALVFAFAALAVSNGLRSTAENVSKPEPQAPIFTYEGTWEGVLDRSRVPDQYRAESSLNPNFAVRIVVHDGKAHVFYNKNDSWLEVKAGSFTLLQRSTNAVLVSITTGVDADGTWVESWVFTLAPLAPNELRGYFQRLVNNANMDRSKKDAVWGAFASGELKRVDGVF